LARGENFSPPRKPGDEGPFIEDFRNTARECIRDGAEVIIVGCGALSPMLSVSGVTEVDGAPVIDPVQTALKYAEMLVDLKKAGRNVKSRLGLHQRAPENILRDGLRLLSS
ncbi:MAG: hypothetical protein ABID87_01375, partial [Chloroflexota bacterium]